MSTRSSVLPRPAGTGWMASCAAGVILASCIPAARAQEKPQAPPRMVTFWGQASTPDGKPKTGTAGVTFSLFQEEQGGAPLWMETQNVTLDAAGGYTAQIGATHPDGLPIGLFASGQARWLEIQVDGQPAARRALLVSVPYALNAVDAQTLGGLPASAFALAGAGAAASPAAHAAPGALAESAKTAPAATPDLTGTGTASYVPIWTNSTTLGSSLIFQQSGSVAIGGSSAALFTVGGTTQNAVLATTTKSAGIGLAGQNTATSGVNFGVAGIIVSDSGSAVQGEAKATAGGAYGVLGQSAGPTGTGVLGAATATTGSSYGVHGTSASDAGTAVRGEATATSGSTYGVLGTNSSDAGTAVEGDSSATSGNTFGVVGRVSSAAGRAVEGDNDSTSGDAIGVIGFVSTETGVAMEGQNTADSGVGYGVYGSSASTQGVGVYGIGIAESTLGNSLTGNAAGVWGDTHDGSAGVFATADSAEALAAYNNATNVATMFVENQEHTLDNANVFATFSAYGGYCDINVSGNLLCSGSVGGHAILPDGAGGSRDVAMYAVQAADNWFEDAGSGQLHNGTAVVTLDAAYAQTVNTGLDYHVFLTPNGDCKGLYVSQKSPSTFEVHELGGGSSSIAFDYRIMARRKGFENIRMADVTGKIQTDANLKSGNGNPRKRPALAPAPARAAKAQAHPAIPQVKTVALVPKGAK